MLTKLLLKQKIIKNKKKRFFFSFFLNMFILNSIYIRADVYAY